MEKDYIVTLPKLIEPFGFRDGRVHWQWNCRGRAPTLNFVLKNKQKNLL